MMKIGIPQALLYYQYYPMWKTFFQELGAEVIVSPPTTQSMLAEGSARVVAETCLPAKVFLGHVLALVKKCDYVFVPAVRSIRQKAYSCSKLLGLPDMTKAAIPESPAILDIDVDVNKGKRQLYQAVYGLGRHFTWNPYKIKQAAESAWQAQLSYHRLMTDHTLTAPQAIAWMFEATSKAGTYDETSSPLTVAVIGHPYLVYDELINHRLFQRLERNNCRVLVPEMLTEQQMTAAIGRSVGKAYWTYEEDVVGAGVHYLNSGIDGVIGTMAFGCGPDSLMMDIVRRQARMQTAPFLSLTLEEHTAEAGILTRLEAFLDMIRRKKRNQIKACV
ncbi:MAG: acyl-CoA dehydratase activase-related protein [Dehalococcoidales bacterium]|nr:acyl-CoA dehydratase activase-related protein [Dehalococcoidales bacterium]